MFCNNSVNNTTPQWKLLLTVTEAKQTRKYLEDFTCFAKSVLEEITDFIKELFDEKTRGKKSQETSYDNFHKKRMISGTS